MSEADEEQLAQLRRHTLSPGAWFTAALSFGGIAGLIWQAYASTTFPPIQLGLIYVLAVLTTLCLLAAGREYAIREGIRMVRGAHVAPGTQQIADQSAAAPISHVPSPAIGGLLEPPPFARLTSPSDLAASDRYLETLTRPAQLPGDLSIELIGIYFERTVFSILGPSSNGSYVLLNLKIVNRSSDTKYLDRWHLNISFGGDTRTAELVRIPDNWAIQRRGMPYPPPPERLTERLDELASSEGLKRGVPHVGWVLFKLSTFDNVVPPYGARLKLILHDSMDNNYVETIRESVWYVDNGEIVRIPIGQ